MATAETNGERPTISVEFLSGEVEFQAATPEAWDAYLTKLKHGEMSAGQRELLMACAVGLKTDPKTGEHELERYLSELPASLGDIADAIEEISGGELEPVVVGRTVQIEGLTFSAPTRAQWDKFQANLKDGNLKGGQASRMLLEDVVDDKAALKALLERAPAVLGAIALPLSKLAGRGIKIQRKK